MFRKERFCEGAGGDAEVLAEMVRMCMPRELECFSAVGGSEHLVRRFFERFGEIVTRKERRGKHIMFIDYSESMRFVAHGCRERGAPA